MLRITLRFVVLLGLCILAAAWYSQERYSNESLLEAYSLDPNLEQIRKATSNENLLAAVDTYQSGDFEKTDSLLLNLLPDDPDFVYGEYLLGHSYLHHDRISNAILSFESVRDFGGSPLQSDAEWMAIMSLIRRGRMDEARILLEEITQNPQNTNTEKAGNLLSDINSWWRHLVFLK